MNANHPTSNESDPRRSLREAITRHAFAVQQVEQAERMLQKANSHYCQLQAEREELAAVSSEIASKRTEMFKFALVNGETILHQEPEGYAVARLKVERVELEMQLTEESIRILEAELDAAKHAANEADLQREWAAEIVLGKEAERLAQKFNDKVVELRRISYMLNNIALRQVRKHPSNLSVKGNGQFYGDGGMRRVHLVPVVHQAASDNVTGDHERKFGFGLRNESAEAVSRFWSNLLNDANAVLDMDEGLSSFADCCRLRPEDANL